MAYNEELKEQFIQLRARRVPIPKIAEQLKVSRRTLQYWSEEFWKEILNARSVLHDEIREKHGLTEIDELEEVGAQLIRVRQAIKALDFGKAGLRELYAVQKLLEERYGKLAA